MALLNSVPRAAQDALALKSHTNAATAQKTGRLAEEISPILTPKKKLFVEKDNLIRAPSADTPSRLSKLSTVFRKSDAGGTITAASSSPLTDGASAVLVMSEEKAKELGYPTDCVLRAYCVTGVDPFPQLLLAPAYAIPKALDDAGVALSSLSLSLRYSLMYVPHAGLSLSDIDLFEIHEAFAAQVLSTVDCLASAEWCRQKLGRDSAVGVIDPKKINPNGSSIAIGHPFAATGGRLITAAINELRRSEGTKRFALLSVCAAGGMGGVAIIERRLPSSN